MTNEDKYLVIMQSCPTVILAIHIPSSRDELKICVSKNQQDYFFI